MFFKERKANAPDAQVLPVLPLRNLVLFPGQAIPLIVGREKSIQALQVASEGSKELVLLAQQDPRVAEPAPDDLFTVGTLGQVVQVLRLPDGTVKVLVEGRQRVRILRFVETDRLFRAEVEPIENTVEADMEIEALVRSVRNLFDEYQNLGKGLPPESMAAVAAIDDPDRLADALACRMELKLEDQQSLLEEPQAKARLERLLKYIQAEIEILQVERKIKTRVKKQMERSQKNYYLNEKMQAIQKELGEKDEFRSEIEELEKKIAETPMSEEASEKANRELRKLKMMPPMSAEATVVRNYLDWILLLPWGEYTEDNHDSDLAANILDEDHFGLRPVKNRILEYLAVSILVQELKGPILCFVGPPGVGKTSLARSIARATNRKFVRLSLGGVRDEAEIRGHRRTYIGALPGKIIQGIRKAGSSNPVFLLDEIDKMSTDFRGDPSAALLEVLDPEQNHTFNDHYLDMDYDLSRVMFICTANSLQSVPPALMDRLEITRIAGYTEAEKLAIAKKYLLPKQRQATGLQPSNLRVQGSALTAIIRNYTKEAGVRALERELSTVCRRVARRVVKHGPKYRLELKPEILEKVLGVPKYLENSAHRTDEIGVVKGLAVAPWGGDMLDIEVAVLPGKGNLILTGLLGDWLKESATAAFSYIRSRAQALGIAPDFQEHHDFHIHYPGNAVRTDGPSAGITMATALVSALMGVPVHHDVAMTGEISLRGRVLPIGGLKEKSLAAHRGGIRKIIIPRDNLKDLREIPRKIRDSLELIPVSHLDEVLRIALVLDDPDSLFKGGSKLLSVEHAESPIDDARSRAPAALTDPGRSDS